MDPIHSDKNQSGNKERPKKSALQSILATLARWGRNFNDWAERYKPSIEVAAVIVALLALLFIYFQIDGINEQTKAIVAQNEVISDQNEASWYGFRPILVVNVNEKEDIYLDRSFPENQVIATADSNAHYSIRFEIENKGRSHATLDSVGLRYTSENLYTKDTIVFTNLPIPPGQRVNKPINCPIRKPVTNLIKLILYYQWEQANLNTPIKPSENYYKLIFDRIEWKITLLTKSEYKSLSRRFKLGTS